MTVEDILSIDKGIHVLCGHSGIHNPIEYIDIIEIPEGMYWANKGDFIITTGYFFSSNISQMDMLLRTLIQRGVVGLGIKLGKYLDSIPSTISDLCNSKSFPLLQIPLHLSYRDITQPVLKGIRTSASNYSYDSESKFLEAIINGDIGSPDSISFLSKKYLISNSRDRYVIVVKGDFSSVHVNLQLIEMALNRTGIGKFNCLPSNHTNQIMIVLTLNAESKEPLSILYLQKIQEVFAYSSNNLSTELYISERCHTLLNLPAAASHAIALANFSEKAYRSNHISYFSESCLDLFVNDNLAHDSLNYLFSAYILPVCEMDAAAGTNILQTYLAWIENGFSINDTALSLYLHRNTVYNRIKAIREALGLEALSPKQRAEMYLSAIMYRLKSRPGD